MGEASSAPAVTAPLPAGAKDRAEAIFAEQVRNLYRLSLAAYAGSLLCATVAVAALWQVAPTLPLLAWAFAFATAICVRYGLYRSFMRRAPPVAEARRWCRWFIAGAGATGLLWGLLGSALYPSGAMPYEFLVMLIISGMIVSAVLVLSPVHHAFLAFLIPSMLPMIPTVFFQGTTLHFYLGVLLLVFFVVMLTAGPLVSQMIQEAIAMKFENTELVARLSETHAA